jgi:anti-sigma regulatory factor (Ser/Thr protein kinase)
MTASFGQVCEVRTELPATLQSIERMVLEFNRRSQALLDRADWFAAELLIREALTNAVIHGCNSDSAKQVRCFWRFKRRRLLIAVGDDGEGFDWRGAWTGTAGPAECSGRGIEILRKYASWVRYNDKGNAVAIVKRF